MKILLKTPKLNLSWTAYSKAAVLPKYSGVPTFIELRVQPDKVHKIAHVKVSFMAAPKFANSECFVLSTEDPPRILAAPKNIPIDADLIHKATAFVALNRKLINDYYFGRQVDTVKVLNGLKNVKTRLTRTQTDNALKQKKDAKRI